MKSASEMKKIAESAKEAKYAVEESNIVSAIDKASNKGETHVVISGIISVYICDKLLMAGYIVQNNESSYQREPVTTTIKWN